jgi:hypothetical protein
MHTEGAFIDSPFIGIEKPLFIRTGCYAEFAVNTFVIIYLHSTIRVIVRSFRWAHIDTGSLAAIVAKPWKKSSPDAWISSTFPNFYPAAPTSQRNIKLCLTGNCTRMTPCTFLQIDNHTITVAFYGLGRKLSFFFNKRDARLGLANTGGTISSRRESEHFSHVVLNMICQLIVFL